MVKFGAAAGKESLSGSKLYGSELQTKRHQTLPPRRASISVVVASVIGDTLAGRRRRRRRLRVLCP